MASKQDSSQFFRAGEIFALSILAVLIGFAGGGAAFALYHLIGFFTNLFFYGRLSWDFVDPANSPLVDTPWRLLFIPIPALGGLLVALMIRYGSEKISGHGIPEAMEAVLTGRSRIQARVGVLKPVSTAVAIGTGGPFGAEGPIITTGGTLGSLVGQVLRVTGAERKTLLACGAAAGMAATFGAPVASILLAIELLLFEFRPRSFIPVAVASAVGTLLHFYIFQPGPLFPLPDQNFGGLGELPLFALLGFLAGLLAVALTKAFSTLEDFFLRLPYDKFWFPVLGGLGWGLSVTSSPGSLAWGTTPWGTSSRARPGTR